MKQSDLTRKPLAFFGDIHGHYDFVKQIPIILPDHHWIFVGDYLDSFSQSVPQQIATIAQIMEWDLRGKASALAGNHDLQYLYPQFRCSGYNPATQAHIIGSISDRMRKILKPCLLVDDILVTHAGLHRKMYDKITALGATLDTIDQRIEQLFQYVPEGFIFQCGISRGGFAPYGGPWWCDWDDEFDPIPNLHQVFGHSTTLGVPKGFTQQFDGTLRYVKAFGKTSWNIDSLARDGVYDILTYDQGKFGRKRFAYQQSDTLTEVLGE